MNSFVNSFGEIDIEVKVVRKIIKFKYISTKRIKLIHTFSIILQYNSDSLKQNSKRRVQ